MLASSVRGAGVGSGAGAGDGALCGGRGAGGGLRSSPGEHSRKKQRAIADGATQQINKIRMTDSQRPRAGICFI